MWHEAHLEVKSGKAHQVRTTFGSWHVEKVHAVVPEAHLEVKSVKTRQLRTTFGSCDVEKVHAVVVGSTCGSQSVQNTSGIGAFLKVEIFKKCTTLWCEAHLEVKM